MHTHTHVYIYNYNYIYIYIHTHTCSRFVLMSPASPSFRSTQVMAYDDGA